jgi:osmoprotectant transport system substrate-binding protein
MTRRKGKIAMQRHMAITRLFGLLAALLLFAACGGDGDGGDGGGAAGGDGAVAESVDLSGVSVTVGSKEFTEQRIVGQMAVAALEAAGAQVTDQTGLTGTETVRTALENGEVDMYWEYTGTGWITILQNDEMLEDAEAYYTRVAEADAENGIVWLEPSEVNNTYAFFTNPANVDLDVASISELAEVAHENPDQATLCAATEFITRPDGLASPRRTASSSAMSSRPTCPWRSRPPPRASSARLARSSRPTRRSSRTNSTSWRTTSRSSRSTTWR